jgi:AcrR family transcriptional regulator
LAKPVKGSRERRTRSYDASRRQAQARATQLAVLRAAHDLFVEHGYARTTLAAVATAAGVSVETIYGRFGNKATLLHRVWDITIGGDDEAVTYHDRPEVLAVRAEPDLGRRLHGQAELFTATARRIGPFLHALQGAAGAEPAAAELLAEIGRQRLAGMSVMASEAAATGQLAVSEEECRDVMWATTDAALWAQLVMQRGWSDERFAAWLGDVWAAALVAPVSRPRRPGRRGGRAAPA